jgi:hypothetical protein
MHDMHAFRKSTKPCTDLMKLRRNEGKMILESVLNNPLPPMKFPWSRRHEAVRLARLALHSLHQLSAAGLGDFNLEVTFSPSCSLSPATVPVPKVSDPGELPTSSTHVGTSPQSKNVAAPQQQTLKFSSPGCAAVPAAAAAASQQRRMQDISIQTGSPSPEHSDGQRGGTVDAHKAAVSMETDPAHANATAAVVSTAAPVSGTHALSRSASCALECDGVHRKGDVGAETKACSVQRTEGAAPSDMPATPKHCNGAVATGPGEHIHATMNATTYIFAP